MSRRRTGRNVHLADQALMALRTSPVAMTTAEVAEAIGEPVHGSDTWRVLDWLTRQGHATRTRQPGWHLLWAAADGTDGLADVDALEEAFHA